MDSVGDNLIDYSFPSGHTAASFTTAMALYLAGENKMWKPALVLAVLIAFSRLYLYVHYPTDILGGIITGCIAAYIGYRFEESVLLRLKWKHQERKEMEAAKNIYNDRSYLDVDIDVKKG